MRTSSGILSIATACAVLALQGCGKQDSLPAAAAPPPAAAAPAGGKAPAAPVSAEASWDKKAQAYIRLNNGLADFNTPPNATFAQWAAEARDKVAKGDFKAIRGGIGNFGDSFVRDMKAAIAIPADMPEADAAAKDLLAAVEQYVPNWKSLEDYNTAKKFEDDNGAEGKRMLPMYREGIEKINAALDRFSGTVEGIAREASAKTMARYKSSGKLLELYNMEALAAARGVADTFDSLKDFKDQDKLARANAQLAVMEAKLAEMKAEHEKRKSESPKSLPMIDRYDAVHASLTSFAGKYRESRKDPEKFNDAVKDFNQAIDDNNRMMR
jgi:hypothetical protein